METPATNSPSFKIKQIEEEIAYLKEKLSEPHLAKSAENDYDIKSSIINKQNELIELLIKERSEKQRR